MASRWHTHMMYSQSDSQSVAGSLGAFRNCRIFRLSEVCCGICGLAAAEGGAHHQHGGTLAAAL